MSNCENVYQLSSCERFFFLFFFAYHLVGLIASMHCRERKPAYHKENKQHSNNLPRKSHLNSWLKGNLYAQYRRQEGGCSGGIAKLANHISHQTALSQARLHLMDIKMSLPLKGGQPRLRFGCARRKAGKGLQQVITSCKPYARTICLTHNTYTHLKMG